MAKIKTRERLDIKGLDRTMLNLRRIFYLKYPQMCDSVKHRLLKVIADTSVEQLNAIGSLASEEKESCRLIGERCW